MIPAEAAPAPGPDHDPHPGPGLPDMELPLPLAVVQPPLGPAVVPPPPRRYPTRERRPPSRDQDYLRTYDYAFQVQTTEPVSDDITVTQALAHSGWRAAMQEEFDSLLSTSTWELGPLPPGQHA